MLQWPQGDSEMAHLIRQHDWALTPLGEIHGWPQSLKTIVDLMLHSTSMMSLVWGDEAIHLYNDPFTELLQEHRVTSLGRSAFVTFARSRDVFAEDLAAGMSGKSSRLLAQRYPVLRDGRLQDAWFDVDYSPVYGESGDVGGVLWILREVTAQVRSEQALRESETRHRLLIESWAQAEWETDPDGVVVDDSPSWRAYTGQSLDEWLGYGWVDAVHPDDRAYVERQWREAVAMRSLVEAEFRLRSPDGGWRWTNVRAAPVFDSNGNIKKWAGINIDIDARKRAEFALRESEERLRKLFDTMGEGFVINELIRDADGKGIDVRYLEFNPVVEKLVGWKPGETIGRLMSEILPREETDSWVADFERVIASGTAAQTEHFHESLDMWFRANTTPIGGDRIALVYQNITAHKRAEIALRDSEDRQAFLLKLSDALRAEPDADAVANRALSMLSDHMNLDRCYITYYRPDEDQADFPHQIGNETVPPLPPNVKLSDFPEAYAEVQERTFVVNDDFERRGLSEAERANSNVLGMRAMLASTLRKGHSLPLASLAAVSSQPRQWTRAEIALVEETAERTWSAIERAHADTALRENEERLSLAIEIGALASWDWDLTSGAVAWNDRHFRMQGYGVGEVTPSFEAWVSRVHPDDREETVALIEKARAGRMVYAHDFRSLHPDGRIVWCSARGRFFYGPDGQPVRMIGVMEDITERVAAEAALRESEARFRQFGEASRSALWVRDAKTFAFEYVSPSVRNIYGVAPEKLTLDERFLGATVLPEERDDVSDKIKRVSLGETIVQEYRILRGSDQAFRWIRSTGFPIYDGEGVVQRIGSIAEDVTEAKIAIEHQGVLLAELQHRVRNIMAMIRSTAVRSADGAADVQDYKTSLAGRLLALARVQTLLTRQANAGGSLRDILESEIGAQAHSKHQYELTGPDIMLSPKAVEVLTLAFHELSTNAVKYGALSVEGGKVSVSWAPFQKQEKPWLAINWIEEGAPLRPPPTRRGFGSELIEAKIPYELRGTGKTTIEPGGAWCHIAFPLREAESILETDAPAPTKIYGGSIDMTGAPDLTGKTILVVEDDYYVASDTAAALQGAGAKVLGPCATEEDALQLLAKETPTAVVLDLNLGGGGPKFQIAHKLVELSTPFIFLTGYDPDVIPDNLAHVVRLQKPVALRDIVEAVSRL